MDEIKKNQFAVIVGGILFVYLVLYFFILYPIYNGESGIIILKEDLQTSIGHLKQYNPNQGGKKEIPSENLIKYHQTQKQKLQKATKEIEDFFSEKSKHLSQVFPEIQKKIESGGVSLAYFQAVYVNEVENFVRSYTDGSHKLEIRKKDNVNNLDGIDGKSRSEEIKEILNFDNAAKIVGDSVQTEVQKKFWIIKYVLEILEAGNLRELNQFIVKEVGSDKNEFKKYSIEFSGNVYYENVSFLIEKVLTSEKLLTEIKKFDVRRDESYEVKVIDVPVVHEDGVSAEERKKKAIEKYSKENPTSPKPVNLKMEFLIWDYQKTGTPKK